MEALDLLVVLGATVLVGTTLGGRYRVAPPVLLISLGVLIALVPAFSHVVLEPEVVLLLFLPAILYRESITTSLREIRANLTAIALLAVGLVAITMVTVAYTAMAFGIDPAAAWVLGAVLAPTDAAAVAGLAKRMPRRLLTTLRAESLINDGTALVLFAVALGLITGHTAPGALGFLERLGGAFLGGVIAGLLVGTAVVVLRKRLDDPLREGALSVLTPFTAFLLAELVHASGVLAVLVAGLVLAWASPRVISARSRIMAFDFWDLSTFLINGGLFVLVGMQIPRAVQGVTSTSLARALLIAVVVGGVIFVTRLVWVHLSSLAIWAVRRRTPRREPRPPWRVSVVAAWAGFRGAVSFAAALAVPLTMSDGGPVHERDLIIFCTALVIVMIMLVQGTTLPLVVRWAGLRGDTQREDEVRLARLRAGEAALAALPEAADRLDVDGELVERLRAEYQARLDTMRSGAEEGQPMREQERRLRLAVLEHKRREVTRLRDRNEIDDIVLRELQAVLDIEEIRLAGPTVNE